MANCMLAVHRNAARAIACSVFALALSCQARAGCSVLDPELQGTYAGGCKDGMADGWGEAAGSAEYKGGFAAGRKHGKGVKTWPSTGDRYEGDFVSDRREGAGVYTWGPHSAWAGEKYTGGYVSDRREGPGLYTWPNGERFQGIWKDDVATTLPTPNMLARARTAAALAASAARPGARICREMAVGIGTRDWVRGTVTAVKAGNIAVRIDDAGRYQHVIAQVPVAIGVVVHDSIQHWIPCR